MMTLTPGRLQALADGIFSIAMTILVFELRLPAPTPTTSHELMLALGTLWPKLLSFVVSFMTLGYSWIGHHNQYAAIRRVNRPFLWINIVFFLFIVLVPFSSVLLGELPFEQLSVTLYAANLVASGLMLCVHWWYARHAGLLEAATPPEFVSETARRVLLAPLFYCAVILVAVVEVRVALVACAVVPFVFILPGKVDRHWSGP